MARILDANQTKKVDKPFSQPIYLVHLMGKWQYSGNYVDSGAATNGSNYFVRSQDTRDHWLTDKGGIKVGDSFRLNIFPDIWGTVRYVDGETQVTLDDIYPAMEGYSYLFRRTITLYFSDRNITYNGHDYEDYLFDLSNIGTEIQNLGGYDNATITLRFKNEKIRNKNYLIELFDDYFIEGEYLEIYKLYHDSGEIYSSDVSTKIFKGVIGQPYEITDMDFKIDCHSILFSKDDKLPLDIINQNDFPDADPDDIGKYRNIIYGNCKKIICPWTVAGWASTLAEDLAASGMSIVVSEVPSSTFNVIIDDETIEISDIVGKTLIVSARGYDGTTPVAHNKAAIIYEKMTYFEAEVAQHPVKSIGDIYVKRSSEDEWLRVTPGYYLTYPDTDGRAYIRFTDKIKFDQQINITAVADTTVDEGNHYHNITLDYSQKECVPDGSSGSVGHSQVIDGNTSTWCGIYPGYGVQARFDTLPNLGTIIKQIIWIYKNDTASTGYVQCPTGQNITTLGSGAGWHRVIKIGGNWTNSVAVFGGAVGNQIGEIYKIVEYTPTANYTQYKPATGVDVAVDVQLSGNSAANVVIGDIVVCDVEGYQDDSSGTYTGTPDALIERPDHIRKHILVSLLNVNPSDINTVSFTDTGDYYDTYYYILAFVLHDVAIKAMDLFKQIDLQTRSIMWEVDGQFHLHYVTIPTVWDDPPTSTIIFNKNNIKGLFRLGKTEIADIKNILRGHFLRDYSKFGDMGDIYSKVIELEAPDSTVQYGNIPLDIPFSCLGDSSSMVNHVLEGILWQKKEIRKTVEFDAFWDAQILQNCDYFYIKSNFWSDKLFKVIKLLENPENDTISIRGLEYWIAPFFTVGAYHNLVSSEPQILQLNFANSFNTIHSQTADSPDITTRIGIPASTTHTHKVGTVTIVYRSNLIVQKGTISQSVTSTTIDLWIKGSIPEIFPPDAVHTSSASSPTI